MAFEFTLEDDRLVPTLESGLRLALREEPWADGITVTDVMTNPYASSWTTGVLLCETAGGSLRSFCKRNEATKVKVAQHTGGLVYEHAVYRNVLCASELTQPRCYGMFTDADGDQWLFLESLEHHERWTLTSLPEANALKLAAWLGHFHAEQEASLAACAQMTWLRVHDAAFHRDWIERVRALSADIGEEKAWLTPLCDSALEWLPVLLAAPRTIIHGELFPHNVLIYGDEVRPIDWETAPVGAGEEDLTSMTDC
ncbi:MAG: hypothetical protein JWM57_3818 [Phycisphaerales bacterium]|nr:hypothetical protein [Phycisphaerales bacterium]